MMMIDDDDAVRAGQTGPHHDMRVGLQRPTHMGGRRRVVATSTHQANMRKP